MMHGDTKCFEDIVQLYGWGFKHTISQEAGDSLLKVLYDISYATPSKGYSSGSYLGCLKESVKEKISWAF